MRRYLKFNVEDSSISGEIRRNLATWAQELGFDEIQTGGISIVVNELSTNILKHAKRGEIICTICDESISILAIDKGPGIGDVLSALKDGFSTHGTAGNGLGAIRRLSTRFDLFSAVDKGTVVLSQFNKSDKELNNDFDLWGFSLPIKGEIVSGDGWTDKKGDVHKVMISDGLGHGLQANNATRVAIETFTNSQNRTPLEDIELMHLALRSTRGAAVSVAYIDHNRKIVEYCGLGNIVGNIISRSSSKRLISYNGTAGVQMRKIQSLPYPLENDSIIVFHSDGLSSNWNLSDYPGLLIKHPLIIAGILYRDFSRANDDVTVIVGGRP